MFLDKARIYVKGGDGGDGVTRWRREKYVPAGGPAGGDGGSGGSVVFEVDNNISTLIDFKHKKHFKAENGEHGQSGNKYGRDGEDLVVRVPPGTIVKEAETGEVLVDLTEPGQRVVVAPGGRGGRGNTHFATATRQAPAFAEKGEPSPGFWLDLELKLIADVGLVGYPNAGKSTFLSVVSKAKPKIANYPFTTIVPNLGVVSLGEGNSFVLADIPGLIEGAHQGTGLGTEFLRHVERTRILIHVVDTAGLEGRDPVEDYYQINKELELYNPRLKQCPQVVVANKVDLPEAEKHFPALEEAVKKDGRKIFKTSAATNQGLGPVIKYVGSLLTELRTDETNKQQDLEAEQVIHQPAVVRTPVSAFRIRQENEDYIVEGEGLERYLQRLDLENEEVIVYLQRFFDKIGLYRALAERKVPDGATVRVGELEFEYEE